MTAKSILSFLSYLGITFSLTSIFALVLPSGNRVVVDKAMYQRDSYEALSFEFSANHLDSIIQLRDSARQKALFCHSVLVKEFAKRPKSPVPKKREAEFWIIAPQTEKAIGRPKLEPFEPIDTGRRGRVVLTSKGN